MFSSFFEEGNTFDTLKNSGDYMSNFTDTPTVAIEKGIDPHFLLKIVMIILVVGVIITIFKGILSIRQMNANNPKVKVTISMFLEETGKSLLIFFITIAVLAFLYGLFIPPTGG